MDSFAQMDAENLNENDMKQVLLLGLADEDFSKSLWKYNIPNLCINTHNFNYIIYLLKFTYQTFLHIFTF